MLIRLIVTACIVLLCGESAYADDAMKNCIRSGLTPPVPLTSHSIASEDYPPLSIALREEGNTVMKYDVTATGGVANVTVSNSSGSLRLDDAATAFVSRFAFKPALDGNQPVACHNAIQIMWKLSPGTTELATAGITLLHPALSDYPAGALKRREEDTIMAFVAMNESGTVLFASVANDTRFADLSEATAAYLKGQKFKPAEVNGVPVKCLLLMAVVWSLAPAPSATQAAPQAVSPSNH
jgi:TonB family protein